MVEWMSERGEIKKNSKVYDVHATYVITPEIDIVLSQCKLIKMQRKKRPKRQHKKETTPSLEI